jgi:hypothetical protein
MTAVSQSEKFPLVRSSVLPVWIIIFITLAALLLGWMVKTVAEMQTRNVERAGIFASVPAGWMVRFGVAQEDLILAASDPFNPNISFSVFIFPSVPGGKLTDSVASRNLSNAKALNSYKVLEQAPVKERNRESFRVVFAYIQPNGPEVMPEVIKGADYYFLEGDQVIVFSMISPVSKYEDTLQKFYRFMRSGKVTSGGLK